VTVFRIAPTVRAVSGEITCRITFGRFSLSTVPSWSKTAFTTYGRMSAPPLAIADRALVSWSAVSETPWPKLMLASPISDQCCGPGRNPEISRQVDPGFDPNPKLFR
jgi:hypothetical protein